MAKRKLFSTTLRIIPQPTSTSSPIVTLKPIDLDGYNPSTLCTPTSRRSHVANTSPYPVKYTKAFIPRGEGDVPYHLIELAFTRFIAYNSIIYMTPKIMGNWQKIQALKIASHGYNEFRALLSTICDMWLAHRDGTPPNQTTSATSRVRDTVRHLLVMIFQRFALYEKLINASNNKPFASICKYLGVLADQQDSFNDIIFGAYLSSMTVIILDD